MKRVNMDVDRRLYMTQRGDVVIVVGMLRRDDFEIS